MNRVKNEIYKFLKKILPQNVVDFLNKVKRKIKTRAKPLKLSWSSKRNPSVNLSITAILKDEAPYIKEWIEYHKLIGVERFYLSDNESTDNVLEILKPYIDEGLVIYQYVKGSKRQLPVYSDAIYHYRNETKWMAFIDLDEFIVPIEKDNLQEFLAEYEDYPAIGINWVMFGSNGHKTSPTINSDMLVVEAYTEALSDYNSIMNKHIKSIINPKKVTDVINPHAFYYKNNAFAVTENFEEINDDENKGNGIFPNALTYYHSSNKICINHYYTKSEEEFQIKLEKDRADNGQKREESPWDDMTKNLTIQKYIPELREKMGYQTKNEALITGGISL